MKKITFKVNSPKENFLVSMMKEISKISCRFSLNFANGFVVVENVEDSMIDSIVDLLNNNYTIEEVHINNTNEPFVANPVCENVQGQISSQIEEQPREESTSGFNDKTECDVPSEQVESQSENINNAINILLRNVNWYLEMEKATERDILNHIYTCVREMDMRFTPKRNVQFSVGDIVEVYYGSHLSGEVNGNHVHGIVCDIPNEFMAYVVPIIKNSESEVNAKSYLKCTIPNDLVYTEEADYESIAILEKGKPIRTERFNKVIGRATPEFLKKLLYQLKDSTFDFTHNLNNESEDNTEVEAVITEQVNQVPKKRGRVAKENSSDTNLKKEETALLEVIGSALDKLDNSKSATEQVEEFMNQIGMDTTTKLVTQSFIVACDIKRINYENVILELCKLNPNIRDEIIKASLKENFKKWLEKYPKLAEKCPRISLMSVLKVFAKRLSKDDNC